MKIEHISKNASPAIRKKLVQMASVAAWVDLEVRAAEREVVLDIARQMGLAGKDLDEVKGWLENAPPEFDPYEIPLQHRQAFLEAFLEVATADGRIAAEESEMIRILRELTT
ncbi:MAG: TerB family tellurite resistance protein [Deltaproteobacteria bacterium]|nr:TerB family tellurite resistance protein [Deltaproteobacteria bacterium]